MASLPPGPSNAIAQTLALVREPYAHLVRCAKRYGDPFTLPHALGDIVMTAEPEGIRAIFSADPELFEVPGKDLSNPLLGENSIIMLDGAPHRAARQMLLPPFHGERMRAYGRLMSEIARAHVGRWRPGVSFPMLEAAQGLTLEIILQAVFGITRPEEVRRYSQVLLDLMERAHSVFVFFKGLRRDFFGLSPWARFQRAMASADALLLGEVATRRAQGAEGHEDILGLLLSARYEDGSPVSDKAIRDELMTLLLAGYDATASMLAWACYLLHRHPAALERLRAEVAALGAEPEPEVVARLPYLEAVCHETMRLYPILGSVIRKLRRPLRLQGYEVPAGKLVGAATVLAHHREQSFPQPHAFQPERFLGRVYSPFEFLPFGGGGRRCLGAAFAQYQLKLVLAAMMRGPRLRLVSEQEVKPMVRGVAVLPAGGVPVVLA